MELKDFIRQSLASICTGVHEAKLEVADKVAIAPGTIGDGKKAILTPSEVEFEVSVSVSESSVLEKSGGAKINVLSGLLGVDGGVKKADDGSKGQNHKLAFKVPVHFNAKIMD